MLKVNFERIRIIVGLGNPGKEYQQTYHNVGFLATDFLAEKPLAAGLLKSNEFMNQSGLFVAKTIKKNGIKPDELMVIHDDSDIELGKYKLSFGRNSAGHRGVDSIIKSLGTKDFWRLRIGIRKATAKKPGARKKAGLPAEAHRAKAGEMVLKKIGKEDLKILHDTFGKIGNELTSKLKIKTL